MENSRTVKISKPVDLAEYIFNYFKDDDDIDEFPSIDVLEELFDCLFYTSLRSEEGQLINLVVTFYNPNSLPLKRKANPKSPYHSLFFPFEKPIRLEVGSLTKLGKAADPWSSSITISYDRENRLWMHGMIDQAIHLQNYLNLEDDLRPDQPGLFQVSITGIGSLRVMTGLALIATLKQESLITKHLNVFREGPVADIIKEMAEISNQFVLAYLNSKEIDVELEFLSNGKLIFSNTISRLLNKIRNYNHGGALLIINSTAEKDLDIKYRLKYDRLSTAIGGYKINKTSMNVESEYLDSEQPVSDKYRTLKSNDEFVAKELKGAIRFVASLSCVDGLVLLNRSFVVNGFGVVIKGLTYPKNVYISSTLIASERSLTEKNTEHYGTRHRTMFAYCFNHPGSLGFVISQDGDIRAITKVEDKLVMWENILTQKNLKGKAVLGPLKKE